MRFDSIDALVRESGRPDLIVTVDNGTASIAGVDEPTKIFKDLVLYYAIPEVIIVILVCLKIIPIIGA